MGNSCVASFPHASYYRNAHPTTLRTLRVVFCVFSCFVADNNDDNNNEVSIIYLYIVYPCVLVSNC